MRYSSLRGTNRTHRTKHTTGKLERACHFAYQIISIFKTGKPPTIFILSGIFEKLCLRFLPSLSFLRAHVGLPDILYCIHYVPWFGSYIIKNVRWLLNLKTFHDLVTCLFWLCIRFASNPFMIFVFCRIRRLFTVLELPTTQTLQRVLYRNLFHKHILNAINSAEIQHVQYNLVITTCHASYCTFDRRHYCSSSDTYHDISISTTRQLKE